MKKNYYCSGLDSNCLFKGELANRLKKDLVTAKRIVFIAGSTKKDKIEKSINKSIPAYIEHFKNIGINFEVINFIVPDVLKDEAMDWVKKSDMIFLLGGNPILQKKLYEEKGLTNLIKNYDGVIMGMSAGAMNMSKYIMITPCSDEYPDFCIEEGLNLSDISVYPHINFEGTLVPKTISFHEEVVVMQHLITVAKDYGKFYCLQDHFDEVNTHVSVIYESDNRLEIITENNGKVIEVNKEGFKFVNNITKK